MRGRRADPQFLPRTPSAVLRADQAGFEAVRLKAGEDERMLLLRSFLASCGAFFRSRSQLALENLALRHQLAVLNRSVPRPRIEDRDRRLWILLRRFLVGWRDALILVQPDTVVRWHRAGFRAYWRRKSKPRHVGRPPIPMALISLIKRLSRENATWGAPRIHDELALLRASSAARSSASRPTGR